MNSVETQSNSIILEINNTMPINNINELSINNKKAEEAEQSQTIITSDNEATKSKIEIYMNALVHSTNCTQEGCTFIKCLQFKRVTRHNKNCKKFINDRCEFCRQLIAISVYHAKNCTSHSECSVPFCQTIKQKLEINKSIDLIANLLNALKYKTMKCQAVQTDSSLMESSSNKRKHSSLLEIGQESKSELNDQFMDDCFKLKNMEMQQKKDAFYEKLREIRENVERNETSLKNDNKTQLSKENREKVFASFFQQILINNPQFKESRTPKDRNYANLIVLLLRKEAELNRATDSMGYVYLITEMFFSFDKILSKYKANSSMCMEVQTDACTQIEETAACTSDTTNEIDQVPTKRLKLE